MKKLFYAVVCVVILAGCSDDKATRITNDTLAKTSTTTSATTTSTVTSTNTTKQANFGGKSVDEFYKYTCAACHGLHADQKALKKSAVIGKWNSKKIESALKGYKAGTYGSTLKGTMAVYVKNLSDDEIKELAKFIPTL